MEENSEQEQEQKPEVKSEQYNKPKDVRLPLPGSLQEIVGSLLFASESPLSAADLRECVRGVEPENGDDKDIMEVYKTCTNREIEEALRGLEKALEVAKCGFVLVCTGGKYRMQTTPQCGRYVRALLKLDRPSRLSRASLETLAIVAYRQPITKAEVEQIRGVSVDTIMKTLSDLGLVRLVGRSELPGHPFLYGTTPFFLEHFGLSSLDQLNEIDPTLPRSNPRERARLFKKEEKNPEQAELSAVVEESKVAEAAATAPAADAAEDAQGDGEDEERPAGYVAEDDEIAIDDTPDEFDDDEDEGDEFDDDDEEFDDDDDDDDEFDDEEDEYDEEDEDDDEYDEEEDDDEESDDTGGGDDDARRMQSDDDI
jgi:segregation and condensation protein B